VQSELLALGQDLQDWGARVTTISNGRPAGWLLPEQSLTVANVPEWLSPFPVTVAGQLLAFHLTQVKGLDPDSPRRLRKVTETR
jgi:glucosamine--fructose-6-phosphate aminotransferase (isomerizing)